MTLPATYKGTPVILWTPEVGQSFLAAQEAFILANPGVREFAPGVVYVNEEGAIVSPNVGLPIGGNVTISDEEMAAINAKQEAVNEGAAHPTEGAAPAPEAATPAGQPVAAIPLTHISEFQRLLDDVESIPAHIKAFFAEHFGRHVG